MDTINIELSGQVRDFVVHAAQVLDLSPAQFVEGALAERLAREVAQQKAYPSSPRYFMEFARDVDGDLLPLHERIDNLTAGKIAMIEAVRDVVPRAVDRLVERNANAREGVQ